MKTALKISDYSTADLEIDHFAICQGEAWCILGLNTSGINSFVELFSENRLDQETIVYSKRPEVISFAKQQEIFEDELRKDNTDFLDRIDPGTLARDFINNPALHSELIKKFNFEDCLVKGYRQLSSGESRKLMLLSTLSRNIGLILFENPYDGLDTVACRELDTTLAKLPDLGIPVVLTINNSCDIPSWCTHLAVMDGKRLHSQGLKEEMLQVAATVMQQNQGAKYNLPSSIEKVHGDEELVHLKNGFARYGDREIFSGLTLQIKCGQHTLITGPNGSGKSTLLQIITGDNHNCYANDLHIFGQKRGSGESIWELKKKMGIVTPDLHRNYYIPGSALQVVLSGFFDSIGVYTRYSKSQKDEALQWLEMVGLANQSQTSFRQLSYARQRLCLIARALIKTPPLLILDEPTQGLDQLNRSNLLDFLELIAQKKLSTILYVSHRDDEFREFFKQRVHLAN